MNAFIGFLAAASPWLLGVLLTFNLVLRRAMLPGLPFLFAGIGGYLGYIGVSGVMWLADQNGTTALRAETLYAIFIFQLCLLLRLVFVLSRQTPSQTSPRTKSLNWRFYALAAPYLALIVLCVFQHSLLPMESWDSLSFWANNAHQYNLHSAEVWQAPFEFSHRHPPTLFLILSWSGWSSQFFDAQSFSHLPWLCIWCSAGLIVFGFSRAVRVATFPSLLLTLVFMSTPLVENHGMLAGYGELFLTTSMLGCCALIIIGLSHHRAIYVSCGTLLSLSSLTLKNTGPFYAFLPLIAFMFLWILQRERNNKTIIGLLLSSILALICFTDIAFTFFGNQIGVNFMDGTFAFAGYDLELGSFSLAAISNNHLTAWFINSSFHQLMIALIACMVSFYSSPKDAGSAFLLLTILLGLLVLGASQLTPHGFEHATPTNDTGHSRFSIPFFSLIILGVAMQLAKPMENIDRIALVEKESKG